MELFAARLKWCRERKNLTQKQVAEMIDMTQSSYSKYEYNLREPKLDILAKLPAIFGESVDFMLGVVDFTENAYGMFVNYQKAESNVMSIMIDLQSLQEDPYSLQIMTSKDYNPDDPKSVADKIERLHKQLPLWKDRQNIARDKVKSMLDEIPFVKQKTYEDLQDDNGWVGLFEPMSKREDSQ